MEIHDGGPYNNVKNWDYVAAVRAWHNGEGNLWAVRARSEGEFEAALDSALARPRELCFIEVCVCGWDWQAGRGGLLCCRWCRARACLVEGPEGGTWAQRAGLSY